MTTTHTPGRLKRIADTKPGDVIYLRPDHAQYKPSFFAIVIGTGRTVTIEDQCVYVIDDLERCVEVVGQQLASECVGLTRREIGEAAVCLRSGVLGDLLANTLGGFIARLSTASSMPGGINHTANVDGHG